MSGKIFMSYRREDDMGFAGRLYDRLVTVFSRDQLFMDVDSIEPGLDFVEILEQQIAESDVLLALIGRGWLAATDEEGERRLDQPNDFVRIEIASALKQHKRVIPILIGDAVMPRANELPEDIEKLATRQSIRLMHERFTVDAERLIEFLKRALVAVEAERNLAEVNAERKRARQESRRAQEDAKKSRENEKRKRALANAERNVKREVRSLDSHAVSGRGGEARGRPSVWMIVLVGLVVIVAISVGFFVVDFVASQTARADLVLAQLPCL